MYKIVQFLLINRYRNYLGSRFKMIFYPHEIVPNSQSRIVRFFDQTIQWFKVTPENKRYEQMLGKKISNVSLYAYTDMIDKQDDTIKEMRDKMDQMQEQIELLK